MTGGGGVGSGLMTEAIDILLIGPPGDGADGETLGDGLIETGGGPLWVVGYGLMASGGGAGVVGVELMEWFWGGEGYRESSLASGGRRALSENAEVIVLCTPALAEAPQRSTPSDSPQSPDFMQ